MNHELFEHEICRRYFIEFAKSINRDHSYIWYHELICRKLQDVAEGKIKKLMIFIPPQHGKSNLASILFPSWVFGKYPNTKLIHAAYGIELVMGFSRNIQRIIDSEFYNRIFPETYLNESNVRTDAKKGYIRTVEHFELVNKKGYYYCAGVGGGITGKPCDIGIVDDPVKGAENANSITFRNKVWEWYLQDFLSRLHNNSKQIIIQTRWHVDDLAGRILQMEDDWEVISLPAIKETNDNPEDIRQIGDALFPELHSIEKLNNSKKIMGRAFASLYQQSPTIEGGNIVKSDWFKIVDSVNPYTVDIWIDTAYTKKTSNDPTGILATTTIDNKCYIIDAKKVYLEFPQLLEYISGYKNKFANSIIRIEPKSCGESIVQVLEQNNYNVVRTPTPTTDKESRLNVASVYVEAGNVLLLKSDWNTIFLNEVCNFPTDKHDEFVDLLCYATSHYFNISNPLLIW